MRLRHARRVDLPAVVDVWVDAFARDPYLRWIQPDGAATLRPMHRSPRPHLSREP